MPHSFRLTVRVNRGEREVLCGEIPDADWEVLTYFLDRFDRLAATRMGKGCKLSFRVTLDAHGVSASGTLPPDDEVDAFLLRMRPFVLHNEQTYFFKVCNIIARHVPNPAIRELVQQQRDLFSGRDFQRQITMQTQAGVLNSDEGVRLWLNALGDYHSDREKEEQLKTLAVARLSELRPLFVSMMIDKAKAVAEVATVVRVLAGRGVPGEEVRFGGLNLQPRECERDVRLRVLLRARAPEDGDER